MDTEERMALMRQLLAGLVENVTVGRRDFGPIANALSSGNVIKIECGLIALKRAFIHFEKMGNPHGSELISEHATKDLKLIADALHSCLVINAGEFHSQAMGLLLKLWRHAFNSQCLYSAQTLSWLSKLIQSSLLSAH